MVGTVIRIVQKIAVIIHSFLLMAIYDASLNPC
jgi:hypothetical protein